MKIILSLILSLSIFSSSARAETHKDDVLVSKKLWYLASLPAWYAVWANVHETSHVLVSVAYEYEIVSYKPYPHMLDGRFLFGSFEARCPKAEHVEGQPELENPDLRCRDGGGRALIMIAPSLVDVAIFATGDALLSSGVVNPDSLGGRLLFLGGMVAPWVDFTLAANAVWSDTSDHAMFVARLGIPRWSTAVVGNAVAVVGLWRLYTQSKAVFYGQPKKGKTGFVLAPFSAGDARGLSLGMKW